MKEIDVKGLDYTEINDEIRKTEGDVTLLNCLGQRFIAAGERNRTVCIQGVPGNALGAYLDGAKIQVYMNAQDATGDTMNNGEIIIHGNVGDAVGYAMRGGEIYVQGNAGYRAGIHMKAYQDKIPAIIIGGKVGSFLGEYQAGGVIAVLGLTEDKKPLTGDFLCTGMHGGKVFLRRDPKGLVVPRCHVSEATEEDMTTLLPYLTKYAEEFGADLELLKTSKYTVIVPDTKNPYKQMYIQN